MRGIDRADLSVLLRTESMHAPRNLAAETVELCPAGDRPAWDDAAFWLTAAAEIEHALMVQYLFAAYSLDPDGAGAQRREVMGIQRDLLQIAREEMGHLVTVQNLLLLIGAPLHFGREHSPYASQIYPFRFKLEALSLDTLAKYVVAESPDVPSDEIASLDTPAKVALFENTIKPAAQRSNDGEMVKNVGPVYACLVDIFPNRLRDDDFRLDRAEYQARWTDWGMQPQTGGLRVLVVDFPHQDAAGARAAATSAVREIGEQGEASDATADAMESHFERFFALYERLDRVVQALGRNPTWPLARDPNTSRDDGIAAAPGHMAELVLSVRAAEGRITDRRTRGWAELFNLRYRLLLECLQHSLHRSEPAYEVNGDRTAKGFLQYWTFSEMRRVKKLAEKLVQMPSGGGTNHAGPPFELPPTLSLPQFEADCWYMHAHAFESGIALAKSLLKDADVGDPFLQALVTDDEDAQAIALSMARTDDLPAGVAPTGFLKTIASLDEGVRGFDPPGMSHGRFWLNKSRDEFVDTDTVVVPGDPAASPLYQRISRPQGSPGQMPRSAGASERSHRPHQRLDRRRRSGRQPAVQAGGRADA